MQLFTREDLQVLLSVHDAPCVTLHLPMERSQANAPKNSLRFKNALRQLEAAMAPWKTKADVPALLARITALDTPDFWADQRETLAVFASPDHFVWWRFAEPMPETVVVSETFHTRCLVKHLQGEIRYCVLALTQNNVTLYEGSRDSLDAVTVPDMPRGVRDLDLPHFREVGISARNVGNGSMIYGSGAGGEVDDKDTLRSLFRLVDRALLRLTHDQKVPLILAALDRHSGLFHEVSKNPALLEERIDGDPAHLGRETLQKRALEILAPRREAALRALASQYGVALPRKRATNYLPNIARAAVSGRVQTLMIEDGRRVAGKLDRASGEISEMSNRPPAPGADDLLDDVAELVLGAGGNVYVLPKALMPTDVGAAAIYRY